MRKNTFNLTYGAAIAAIYTILTLVMAPISFGQIQFRISEALCILPYFTPAAVPGLFVGCLLGNLLGGATLWDIIFGSLATLLGALGTWAVAKSPKHRKWMAPVPPVAANTIAIPLILRYAYGLDLPLALLALFIFIGEFVCAGLLGLSLLTVLNRYRSVIFR